MYIRAQCEVVTYHIESDKQIVEKAGRVPRWKCQRDIILSQLLT